MKTLPNYIFQKKIGSSTRTEIHSGIFKHESDRILCIKAFDSESISSAQKQYYFQKIEHLKVLSDKRLLAPLAFYDVLGNCFIIRDYFEGLPLDEFTAQTQSLTHDIFFKIAIGLAEMVEHIHKAGVIHGGIKPHNVLVTANAEEMKLVDFISPLDVRNVSHFIYDADFVRNTLSYTSPEQTGRINHRVEFTTDIYSLGVIFYEILAGCLPYTSTDPLELIHFHLAEKPRLISDINPQIPLQLSNIIEKMILKEPEKRYQRASGLISDLLRFKSKYDKENDSSVTFSLGLNDHAHRVTFISKMVGRDPEARSILKEYELTANGEFRSAFISGFSGIGKTRLIQELQQPIIKARGYFTSGKFDVYQKNIPYSSLIQAFRNLIRTFLTESDHRVIEWKEKIAKAVGKDGAVLTEVVPELKILIGECPALPSLPPVEQRNRFNRVFGDFLQSLCSKDSPLVLFIDDLQWCDVASFEFLTNVFLNRKEFPYLLLLGAYRHNEVSPDHPLCKMIATIETKGINPCQIRLGPILPEYCHEMVSYILDVPLEMTEKLATFLAELTQGNPLFVSEALSYLYNEGLLIFDDAREEWDWNLQQIKHSNMPHTIVELFGKKVGRINPTTFELLEYCACMGNTFTPVDVSSIRKISLLQTFEILRPALEQGLLIENKNELQFVHDKVQEASLAKVDTARRRKIHSEIAHYLIDAVPEENGFEKADNIFTIASHTNIAAQLDIDAGESISDKKRYQIIEINFHAGNSALNSLATNAANEYFKKSCEFLPDDCWQTHYQLSFQVHQKLAKTELMVGNYDSSEKLIELLFKHAKTDLDRAQALAEQTTSLSSIGNFNKAIETANRGLAIFNQDIPTDNKEARDKCEVLMAEIHKEDDDVWGKILNMSITDERKSKIELAFYSELIPDLYMSGLPDQLYLAAAQSTQLCMAGGMDESVIYSFSIMGLNLGEKLKFELASRYETLAVNLSHKYPNTFGSTRGINGVVWCNMHSHAHPDEIVNYCLVGIQSGRNCGDLYNAGLCYGPLMWNLQVKGDDFAKIEEYTKECYAISDKFQLLFSKGLAEAVKEGFIGPMKRDFTPSDMTEKIKQWETENHIASAGSYFVLLGISHYFLGQHEKAQAYLDRVNDYLHGLTDNVLKRQWFAIRCLNAIKLHRLGLGSTFDTLEKLTTFVAPKLERIALWAPLGPLLQPYLAFLNAEYTTVCNKVDIDLYLNAIETANRHDYTLLKGFIYETAANTFLKDRQATAKLFLHEAKNSYESCGAERMLLQLFEQHGELLNFGSTTTTALQGIENRRKNAFLSEIDIDYFFQTMFALSSEIDIDTLLKKAMDIALESSGGHSGSIISRRDDRLFVLASSSVDKKAQDQPIHADLDACDFLPKSMIRFVERTSEIVYLKDAMTAGNFSADTDVQRLKLRSVLCLPLVRQKTLVGVLFLENKLNDTVFSEQQIEVTNFLCNQMAISLENALLVDKMRKAEQKIQNSLGEKEVLLSEIHHRVKNNLQIISSLLRMQARNAADKDPTAVLREAQNRIRSMALLHERLYQSKNFDEINVADYIKPLIENIAQSYGLDAHGGNHIDTELEVDAINFHLDSAIPLGIIINEVVTNAIKHAFNEKSDAKNLIRIHLKYQGSNSIRLLIHDSGCGISETFDVNNAKTLGFQLVASLSEQLNGTFEFLNDNGTQFILTLPISNHKVA